jgi:hypothetical protein
VVLKLPNARADAARDAMRPRLAVRDAMARVVLLAEGGQRVRDVLVGPGADQDALEIPRGVERIVAIGQGTKQASEPSLRTGFAGWHAGMELAHVGWSTAVGPGCVVRRTGERLKLHRERLEGGWVNGAELTRGNTTVATTFAEAPKTLLVVLDDPAAAGDPVSARRLLLGLDGAVRARDAAGTERAPVLLIQENRSVLAYDIIPEGDASVVVTISSQAGWSLVGVIGSAEVDAKGAIALVAERGLDTVIRKLAPKSPEQAGLPSRLAWVATTRSAVDRVSAQARAVGGARLLALPRRNEPPPRARSASRKGGRR